MITNSDEETNDPLVADVRNFYKVEKWTRDGMKVDSLFYAGNNLDKRETFLQGDKAAAVTPYVLRSVRISDAAANLSVLSAG